jgi:thioredoxin-related protein
MKKVILTTGAIIFGVLFFGLSSFISPVNVASSSKPIEKTTGIQFTENSFAEILKLAKKEKKNIFFDAYASWCGPCKLLKKDVFTQTQVGDFFNKNFINVAMDMEKGEGVELSKKFKITAYPTLLFINSKGELIGSALGYHKAEERIALQRFRTKLSAFFLNVSS